MWVRLLGPVHSAAGGRFRRSESLRRLSRIRWNLCRGDEAVVAAEAAVSALEPLDPSVELARAYATHANQRMLYSDDDVAIDLAVRAQALASGSAPPLFTATRSTPRLPAAPPRAWTGPA